MIAVFGLVRAIHFASLMLIFGASGYLLLLRWRLRAMNADVLRATLAGAAVFALVSGLLWPCLVAGQMSGDWHASFDMRTVSAVIGSTLFGHVFVWRCGGLVLLPFACLLRGTTARLATLGLSGCLLAGLAATGHAASSGEGSGTIFRAAIDTIHLLGGGFWLGSLAVLAYLTARERLSVGGLLGPLRLFSDWGTGAVAAIVLTGIVNAAVILCSGPSHWSFDYAALLSIKALLAAAMIGFAAINRWRHSPALRAGDPQAAALLARNIATEIALGLCIIGVVGYLGLLPPH